MHFNPPFSLSIKAVNLLSKNKSYFLLIIDCQSNDNYLTWKAALILFVLLWSASGQSRERF